MSFPRVIQGNIVGKGRENGNYHIIEGLGSR